MLEDAGLLTWVNRIKRVREEVLDMFGQWSARDRVVRTSNAYRFIDPQASKSEFPSGTSNQHSFIDKPLEATPLETALTKLKAAPKRE